MVSPSGISSNVAVMVLSSSEQIMLSLINVTSSVRRKRTITMRSRVSSANLALVRTTQRAIFRSPTDLLRLEACPGQRATVTSFEVLVMALNSLYGISPYTRLEVRSRLTWIRGYWLFNCQNLGVCAKLSEQHINIGWTEERLHPLWSNILVRC